MNDLKGVWKTIKKASNLPAKVSNTSSNLDADESNKYFAQIGPNIQEEVSKGGVRPLTPRIFAKSR